MCLHEGASFYEWCFAGKHNESFSKGGLCLHKRRIRVRLFSVMFGLAFAAVSWVSAAAYTSQTAGTDVWVSVVPRPSQERISVTVPAVIGFVVNGTADNQDQEVLSTENGNILVPNVKVESVEGNQYTLVVEGSPTLVIKNYSTNVKEGQEDAENPERVGIGVKVTGTLSSESTATGADGVPWVPIAEKPAETQEAFKNYRLSLGGKLFSKSVDGGFEMAEGIEIGAPPAEEYGWTAGGASLEPFQQELALGVEVGGTRSMYSKPEESVKAAKITWKIQAVPSGTNP